MKTRLFIRCLALAVICPLGSKAEEARASPDFYAFQNGLGFGTPAEEARALMDLGYSGVSQVGQTGEALKKLVSTYEVNGLRVLSVYLDASEKPVPAEAIRPLADHSAIIELTVKTFTPTTVGAVRETCETAASLNISVALYPHHGFAVATMPQAMGMIEKVRHPALGVMFNLCHFLKSEDPAELEKVLTTAGDRLFAVSTNGADTDGKDWSTLIRPLDQGTFPQKRLTDALEKAGFKGPVSLQCYAVPGARRENLARSMAAWRGMGAAEP